MHKHLKSIVAASLCTVAALAVAPDEVLAGPVSAADPSALGLSAPVQQVYYRRYYRRHYRRYSYDPSGAIVAGAALGLVGAGIAAATAPRYYYPGYYGYPAYGYPAYGYPGYYPGWGW